METSAEINEIALALCKAQGEFSAAAKDSTNPHFKSKYADLTSCIEATRDALVKNDLCITQHPTLINEGAINYIIVTTMLVHKSGQFFRSTLKMFATESHPQKLGGIITYARRYAYAAILQISQEDNDQNVVVENFKPEVKPEIKQAIAATVKKIEPEKTKLRSEMIFNKEDEKHLISLNKALIERNSIDIKDKVIEELHGKHISELNNIIKLLKAN